MNKARIIPLRSRVALGSAAVLALSSIAVAAQAATVSSTPVSDFPTSTWTPPSSDPSGITFIPGYNAGYEALEDASV